MYQMLRRLSTRHEVHLLTVLDVSSDEDTLAPLRAFCQVDAIPLPAHTPWRRLRTLLLSSLPDMALRGRSAEFARTLAAKLEAVDFDLVQAESIEMAQYGQGGPRGARNTRRPLWCYDAFNAEYLLQYRAFRADLRRPVRWGAAVYSLAQWRRLRRYERGLAGFFDLALAVSAGDRETLRRLNPALPVELVPNGVDTEYFRRAAFPRPTNTAPYILFTGTLDFRPNVDAISWFVREIWPMVRAAQPDLRLCVVGQRPAPVVQALGATSGVEIVGPVADVRPWFADAAAYVLPMRVGGGVRLKLLEAWAMEVPCVTTSLGAEGVEDFRPGRHALVADQPRDFAEQVARLLADPGLGQTLAAAGRHLVNERYDWAPIIERMHEAWARHLALKTDSLHSAEVAASDDSPTAPRSTPR